MSMMCRPMWPFLLMYETHSFSQVDNGQRDPRELGRQKPGRGIINKASFKAFSINLCNSPLTKFGWCKCPVRPRMVNAQLAQTKVRMALHDLSDPVWLMPN